MSKLRCDVFERLCDALRAPDAGDDVRAALRQHIHRCPVCGTDEEALREIREIDECPSRNDLLEMLLVLEPDDHRAVATRKHVDSCGVCEIRLNGIKMELRVREHTMNRVTDYIFAECRRRRLEDAED